jgi:hypothetical protein
VLGRLADAVDQCRARRGLTLEVYLLLAEAELKLRLGSSCPGPRSSVAWPCSTGTVSCGTALGRAHHTGGDTPLAVRAWGDVLVLYDHVGNETETVAVMALLPEHRHTRRR